VYARSLARWNPSRTIIGKRWLCCQNSNIAKGRVLVRQLLEKMWITRCADNVRLLYDVTSNSDAES
jgi:hypothetical protein